MEGKITGFIGLLLLAGFTLLIVWKVPSPPRGRPPGRARKASTSGRGEAEASRSR